ncbi:hypothetical protein [Chryseobacterium sp. Leaf394]|uniref:hypothetical protein n=1 Tax=Chryseobacterium sp. Leaf394 TaxID=1736361 RepID=UPI0006FCCE9E|nr:hypothetical protein [Chryseobacterium sp. Leaf394]KQS94005.1 hypothetical protein ASG21_19570 [Chryseobacterium sp. Leaf394]
MLEINKNNYYKYKAILEVLWEFNSSLMGIEFSDEISPIKILTKWETESSVRAHKALKVGLMDNLSQIKYLTKGQTEALNSKLIANNLPKIEILTAEINNIIFKILKRNKIKDFCEYNILIEVLNDTESEIGNDDRTKLEKIINSFLEKS